MAMHYSSNKGLLAKQTAHPPSAASHVHTATKERTENSLLQVTQKIDSADQVASDTVHWLGVLGVGCGKRHGTTVFINHCHREKVVNRMKGREGKHRPPS